MATSQAPLPSKGGDDDRKKRKEPGIEKEEPVAEILKKKRHSKPANPAKELEQFRPHLRQRIRALIGEIRDSHGNIPKYKLGKAGENTQNAHTTGPKGAEYVTSSGNMHSEMVCIKDQLVAGTWKIAGEGNQLGGILGSGNKPVPARSFSTKEPHCGVCTIFLHALNLPLSKPTCGKGLLGHLSYPLPPTVEQSAPYLMKLLGGRPAGFLFLKEMIGAMTGFKAFVLTNAEIQDPDGNKELESIDWHDFCLTPNLKVLWDFIKETIFEVTGAEKKKCPDAE